jgi:predicted small lipoprotein YifL
MAFCKTRAALAALSVALLAACGDSGPSEFDAAGMNGDLTALNTIDDDNVNQAWEGVSQVLGDDAVVLARIGSFAQQPVSARQGQQAAALLRSVFSRPALSASSAAVPEEVAGKTYVWDTESDGYVASDREGAPANGFRAILYAMDNFGNRIEPLVETGYVEFTDLSSGTTRKGRLMAVAGSNTIMDYTATVTGNDTHGEIEVDGYLVLPAGRLNVDFSLEGSVSGSNTIFSLSSKLEMPSRDASFSFDLSGTSAEGSGDTQIQIQERIESPHGRLDVSGTSETGEDVLFTIEVNGETWATYDGSELTPAEGHTLTGAEHDVLVAAAQITSLGFLVPIAMITPVAIFTADFPPIL